MRLTQGTLIKRKKSFTPPFTGKRRRSEERAGFTLVELVIVLAVIATVFSVVGIRQLEQAKIKLAQNSAAEMRTIQEAAKRFYIDNSQAWPVNIAALQGAPSYLDPTWTANNKFGNPYAITSTATTLDVSTDVPTRYANIFRNTLPAVTATPIPSDPTISTVTSTIPIPGRESSHVPSLLHRFSDSSGSPQDQDSRTARANIWAPQVIDTDDPTNTFFLDANGVSQLNDAFIRQAGRSLSAWTMNFSASSTSAGIISSGTISCPSLMTWVVAGSLEYNAISAGSSMTANICMRLDGNQIGRWGAGSNKRIRGTIAGIKVITLVQGSHTITLEPILTGANVGELTLEGFGI